MFSKRYSRLHPYVPGEQPTDRPYIKLNANENPFPPSPRVKHAVSRALEDRSLLARYPDPDSTELRVAIAEFLNNTGGLLSDIPKAKNYLGFKITPDMIFCGNGSDEVLSFVFCTFFDSDRPVILPEFTYSFYPVYCGFYDIPMCPVPLGQDWTLDADRMVSEAQKTQSPVIFANPNAPTGLALTTWEVKHMIEKAPRGQVFVVDEAYTDFSDQTCLPLLAEYDNIIIVRTFSKSLSFAGMRLGFAVASPHLIHALLTSKNSFNHFPVDVITQRAGAAVCEDIPYCERCVKDVIEERNALIAFLKQKGWFVLDSKANFVFAKKEGVAGKEIYGKVKERGILIRHFDTKGIEDFVRITIGTKKQMDALKAALEDI